MKINVLEMYLPKEAAGNVLANGKILLNQMAAVNVTLFKKEDGELFVTFPARKFQGEEGMKYRNLFGFLGENNSQFYDELRTAVMEAYEERMPSNTKDGTFYPQVFLQGEVKKAALTAARQAYDNLVKETAKENTKKRGKSK